MAVRATEISDIIKQQIAGFQDSATVSLSETVLSVFLKMQIPVLRLKV